MVGGYFFIGVGILSLEPNTTETPRQSALSPVEAEELRRSLTTHFADSKGILGSQLGALIRRHLKGETDIKRRFGGLKSLIASYFPAEIVWSGKQGQDDVYETSFRSPGAPPLWSPVPQIPSGDFWSKATNPSMRVQFAWSDLDKTLMVAPMDALPSEHLKGVAKLTKSDYESLARSFANSLDLVEPDWQVQAIEAANSNLKFSRLIREKGLLPKWEAVRVEEAVRVFGDRLAAIGAEPTEVTRWTELLRESQEKARLARLKPRDVPQSEDAANQGRPSALQAHVSGAERVPATPEKKGFTDVPDSRRVAQRAIEFLSDSELAELRLPLGPVMRAVASLLTRP